MLLVPSERGAGSRNLGRNVPGCNGLFHSETLAISLPFQCSHDMLCSWRWHEACVSNSGREIAMDRDRTLEGLEKVNETRRDLLKGVAVAAGGVAVGAVGATGLPQVFVPTVSDAQAQQAPSLPVA